MMTRMDVRSCICFDGRIEEAAQFYVSLVPGSELGEVSRYPDDRAFPGPHAGAVSGGLMRMRKIDIAELEAAAAG